MKNHDILRLIVTFLIFLFSFPLAITGAPLPFTLSIQAACMLLLPFLLIRVLRQAYAGHGKSVD